MSYPCSLYKCVQYNCSIYNIRSFNTSTLIYNKQYNLKKVLRITRSKMASLGDPSLLLPPPSVRGLRILDKKLFNKEIKVPVIVLGSIVISKVMPHLKPYVLKMDNLKPIQTNIALSNSETKENDNKCILLNPLHIENWLNISEKDRDALTTAGITADCFKTVDFTLTYENWKADELLRAILPEDKNAVAGFTKIGHIIHVNLRDYVLEYKHIVAQILMEKVHGARTVVNKLDKIDNTYRNFEMEVLCGSSNMLVKVLENRCRFEFDFSTVYWNSRLSTEHERIVKLLEPGDILYDIFAGVGPFSIPAAKKRCSVFANDLNPESFNWLNHNATINKIKSPYLQTFNKDGRDFILNELKIDLIKRFQMLETNNMYITMNLPALAPTFLPLFNGLLADSGLDELDIRNYPKVFVYCFAKGLETIPIAIDLVELHLGHKLPESADIFIVRKVSSMKEMVRVSFMLNREILFGKKRTTEEAQANETKKFCHGQDQRQSGEKCVQSGGSEKPQAQREGESR